MNFEDIKDNVKMNAAVSMVAAAGAFAVIGSSLLVNDVYTASDAFNMAVTGGAGFGGMIFGAGTILMMALPLMFSLIDKIDDVSYALKNRHQNNLTA